jgi:tRNA(Ile)-lysidine synthase
LFDEWRGRGWPASGERVVVAVSGGADSTALMLALEELRRARRLELEFVVAHLDHGLRERSEDDARWVERQARAHGFEVVTGRAAVGERARARRDNLEQAARRARYEFLTAVARERGAAAVLTAHTLDDQAETILLRLLRGSGTDGLGGMRAERELEESLEQFEEGGEKVDDGGGKIEEVEDGGGKIEGVAGVVLRRPLLDWARRAETEKYCRERGVEFRSDEMNEDERFARVRVRRRLLPLLETFNPRAVESLARAASLLREDSAALESLAAELLEEANAKVSDEAGGAWPLRVEALAAARPALRRRALRQWLARGRGGLRRIELAHLVAVERLLEGARGGRVAELPGGGRVERRRGLLVFHRKKGLKKADTNPTI